MKNKAGEIIGKGSLIGNLFKLHAHAIILDQERTNLASMPKISWDQWHRRYGHILIRALQ